MINQEKVDEDLSKLKTFLRQVSEPEPYWTVEEAEELFIFHWFSFPGVVSVTRRSDGVNGFIYFADAEACISKGTYGRLYFNFRRS